MMKLLAHLLFLPIYLLNCGPLVANTGVFNGAGSQVMPIKNSQIQLKEEEVNITLTIPNKPAKWGVSFFIDAHVVANFHLDNTTDATVPLQLGFPFLSTQGFGDEETIIKNLNFQVTSNGSHKPTEMKHGLIEKSLDPKGLFDKVITWEENFEALSHKDIKVTYDLPLSFVAMNIGKKLSTYGLAYTFSYITKTAYTWRNPVNKAVFHINLSNLPEHLTTHLREHLPDDIAAEFGQMAPLVYFRYPMNGDFADNTLTMTYKDQIPIDTIDFEINVVMLPAKVKDMEKFIQGLPELYRRVAKTSFIKEPYNEERILNNILNFYKGLYQGRITNDLLNSGDLWGLPITPEEANKLNMKPDYIKFLLKGDYEEVGKIIDALESTLATLKYQETELSFLEYGWL